MKFLKILLISLLCIISINLYSQESLQLKKGILNTTDGRLIKFSSLQQNGSEFQYSTKGSKLLQTFDQNDILSISKKDGDNTVLYALALGASGCLGAILGVNNAQRDLEAQNMTVDKESKKDIVLGLTVISTLAGAIWGASTPKYSKVYENPDYATRFIDHLDFSVSVGNETQLCIRYKF